MKSSKLDLKRFLRIWFYSCQILVLTVSPNASSAHGEEEEQASIEQSNRERDIDVDGSSLGDGSESAMTPSSPLPFELESSSSPGETYKEKLYSAFKKAPGDYIAVISKLGVDLFNFSLSFAMQAAASKTISNSALISFPESLDTDGVVAQVRSRNPEFPFYLEYLV